VSLRKLSGRDTNRGSKIYYVRRNSTKMIKMVNNIKMSSRGFKEVIKT
jgi:hypothetical protein